MPRILITGNGFDLHHKLPTTYKDFIKITSFLLNNNSLDFASIYGNSESFKEIKENFKNDIVFVSDNVLSIIETANKNLLFNFFKHELEIDTWIDFENKIEYLLKNIFYGLRLLRKTLLTTGFINPNRSYSYKAYLESNVIYINVLSFFNIIRMDSQEFHIDSKFLIKKYDRYVDIDEEKIINLLYSQLIEFRKLFNLYIQTFVIPLYDKYENDDHLTNIFTNIDYYFTFNYTPTFEKLYNLPHIKVNYLHGKSQEDSENIVFGISDLFDEECKNSEYIKFTKYFQKFNNKTDFYYLNKVNKLDSENYIFYFWGHSLDKSDSNYIDEVFDFIVDSVKESFSRIVIVYHNESSRSRSLLNLFAIRGKVDIENKIRNKKLSFFHISSVELNYDLTQSISVPPKVIIF